MRRLLSYGRNRRTTQYQRIRKETTMIIYGDYTANAPCRINFMEFEFKNIPERLIHNDLMLRFLNDQGESLILTVDWDESEWGYNENTKEGTFRLKGVWIHQAYANGEINLFKNCVFDTAHIYGPEDADFKLTFLDIWYNSYMFRRILRIIRPHHTRITINKKIKNHIYNR